MKIALGLWGLITLTTVGLVQYTGSTYVQLMSDPGWLGVIPFYHGFQSNMGVYVMTLASGAGILASAITRERIIIATALFSMIFAFDDLVRIHENLFPNYLGTPESVIYGFYALYAAAYYFLFFSQIPNWIKKYLVICVFGFGVSVVIDLVLPDNDLQTFIEETLKLLGITFWCTYTFCLSADSIQKKFGN